MTIDLDRYRNAVKPICKSMLDREPTAPMDEIIGRMALATNCPLIACIYYVAELRGWTPELRAFADRLIEFYRVDGVINEQAAQG